MGFANKTVMGAIVIAGSMTTALASTVQITPLGAHAGEFCHLDRAMVFEDPDGTRILYDPGRTVAGADDPRLGDIDAVLVTHMHGDHVGDKTIAAEGEAGECAKPAFPNSALPNTNAVDIAVAKGAKIVTGSEMPKFFGSKLEAAGGDPKNSVLVRFGASTTVGGVTITTVPAVHSNGISGSMIGGTLGELLSSSGLTAYAGPPTGYVLTFSNGLVAYLSGDTGVTAEQETVVQNLYGANLAVINIGNTFTTGPKEAAWVIDNLVKPAAVIPSHANQPSTAGGEVIEGTRLDVFLTAVQTTAHVPLSSKTMAFDGNASCLSGC